MVIFHFNGNWSRKADVATNMLTGDGRKELLCCWGSGVTRWKWNTVGGLESFGRQRAAQHRHRAVVISLHTIDGQDAPQYHLLLGAHKPREHEAGAVAQHQLWAQVMGLGGRGKSVQNNS